MVCTFCVHVQAKCVSASLFFLLLSAIKADFFNREQYICVLFTDPQILLFNNFFIKNGSHGIIHTFKNYFATVFFSFQFQFSIFNCIQTDPDHSPLIPVWIQLISIQRFCFFFKMTLMWLWWFFSRSRALFIRVTNLFV